jgi:hypothetical protein
MMFNLFERSSLAAGFLMLPSTVPEEFDLLDRSCEAFDQEIRRQIDVAELKELATNLIRRYPADPADLAVYGGCGACPSPA